MDYLFVRHKVAGFSKWMGGYIADLATRNEVGLKELKLLQPADDPNEVLLLFEVTDLARAKTFTASDQLRNKMKEIGLVGSAEILFLKDLLV